MNCSELKYHLYINHVEETPNCLCGCIETPQHYFFECPLYLTNRDISLAYFWNTEAPLSLKNILFGDIQENMTKTLITAVEKYICEAQRFSILSLCEWHCIHVYCVLSSRFGVFHLYEPLDALYSAMYGVYCVLSSRFGVFHLYEPLDTLCSAMYGVYCVLSSRFGILHLHEPLDALYSAMYGVYCVLSPRFGVFHLYEPLDALYSVMYGVYCVLPSRFGVFHLYEPLDALYSVMYGVYCVLPSRFGVFHLYEPKAGRCCLLVLHG